MQTTLPDGTIMVITARGAEHRASDGTLIAARTLTDDHRVRLAAWAAAQPDPGAAAIKTQTLESALDATRAQVRAATVRLAEIHDQGKTLSQSGTATAVQRQIGAALADLATIVRALARVTLREVGE